VDACASSWAAPPLWRGFDGGQEAREQLAAFFARLDSRSRHVPEDKSEFLAGGPP
jgi:hypothetical protein